MKNFTLIIALLLTFQLAHSFQLQGLWSVAEISGSPVIYESVTMQVSDSVYRNVSIIQNLVFTGCQSYQYLLQFSENYLFIKYGSFEFGKVKQQMGNSSIKCTSGTARMHSLIRSNLVQVFYFQIVGNYLVFLNPKKQIMFKFQRIESRKNNNLRGIWNLYRLKSAQISQKVQIGDTEITFCKGKLSIGYNLTSEYGFKTRLVLNDGCDTKDLQKTVLSSAFFRKIGPSLEVYDSGLNLLMLLEYISDIDLIAAEANRLKAIQEAKKKQQQAAQIQAQTQASVKSGQTSLLKTQFQVQSQQSSLTLLNTKEDLLGIWQLVSVMGIPLTGGSVYFIFTSNVISYNGGCNLFQFQYTVGNLSKALTIGQNKSSRVSCSVDDDGLYVNGMGKVKKYGLTIVGNDIRLRLSDESGNVMCEMRKTVQIVKGNNLSSAVNNPTQNFIPSASNPNTPPSTAQSVSLPSLQKGKYVFLVLARRDLPRKFCTLTDNKITYTGCNTIEHTIKFIGNNQLKITGGPITFNKCTVNNDEILSNAFNSIISFASGADTGSYMLKNNSNIDVLNLSLF